MPGDKYLFNNAGTATEKAAVQSSGGAGDAGKIPALNAQGKIDSTMLDQTPARTMTASENITGPAIINVHNSSGSKVRKADNSGIATAADGYAQSSISSGASGSVTLGEGVVSGFVGLTEGAVYFLGTAGGVTATPPTSAGNIVQRIGKAVSTTEIAFDRSDPIVLA